MAEQVILFIFVPVVIVWAICAIIYTIGYTCHHFCCKKKPQLFY